MKRFLSLLLAALTLLSAGIPTFAAEEPVVTEEPAATEEPVVTEEPAVTEEPETPEGPAAIDAEASPISEEDGTDSGSCGSSLRWTYADGVLTISGRGKMDNFWDAPWVDHQGQIHTAVIQTGVTSIGDSAFENCTGMTSVTLPDGLTRIGDSAFSGCAALTGVTLPDSLTDIGDSAFSGCSGLAGVAFPAGLDEIGSSAFSGCTGLTSVTIPSGVTYMGEGAFSGCTGLTSVTVLSMDCDLYIWDEQTLGDPATVTVFAYDTSTAAEYAEAQGYTLSYLMCETPAVSALSNDAAGVKIAWEKVAGASRYRLFYKGGGVQNWKKLADVDDTSYLWEGAKSGTEYAFTVRCISSGYGEPSYISEYDTAGVSILYVAAPTVTISNAVNGVYVSWNKVAGAAQYAVYYSQDGGPWQRIGCTAKTSYTWKKATIGKTYVFTVRCADAGKKDVSAGLNSNELKYSNIPQVQIANDVNGVKVTWNKVTGAARYAVYYRLGSGSWKKIGTTAKTSYTWKKAQSGKTYSFAVRCTDAKNKNISGFASSNKLTYIAAPKISAVTLTKTGVKITWGKVTGAAKYQVFYKLNNAGSWKKLAATSAASYTWKKAKNGCLYTFTVRCLSKDGKSYTSAFYPGKNLQLLSNGKLATEKNVQDLLYSLRKKYPEGKTYTDDDKYYSPVLGYGGGCSAYAFICSDTVFGEMTPSQRHSDFDKIRPGDHLRINTPHSLMVLEKRKDSVIVTEGNYGGIIHWGREISREYLEEHEFYADTRYAG